MALQLHKPKICQGATVHWQQNLGMRTPVICNGDLYLHWHDQVPFLGLLCHGSAGSVHCSTPGLNGYG